ncbi:MAG: ABC transporter permease [Palaeococcus sp.]|uniref:ABC transporter permease n=1 Tax=Palaeococcus sp. (in: euryarchaeotes) TaxID=2820298 RepID=UPI0025DE169D|nr:ABC transporter permease [Palaeococcus sp. (in: euryarchaeotes)]MCD6558984.1 ABC transporter permease [Palaeococcus sp. (in: euryarchaeotes)]
MGDFLTIVMKELRHMLRDKGLLFGIIVVPLLLYPALGHLMQVGMQQAQEETKVVLVNFDTGNYGNLLIKSLEIAPNVTVTRIEAKDLQDAINKAKEKDYNVVVVIPGDFSTKIDANEKTNVEIYAIFKSVSTGIRESVSEGRINAVVNILNEYLAKLKIKNSASGDPEAILHPIEAQSYSVIKDRVVEVSPSIVVSLLSAQGFSIPIIIFLMVMVVSQMAAGTMAMEKENKTLETLLTLPVNRLTIVAGKITGTAVMGLIASITYMIGMRYYMSSLIPSGDSEISLEALGLTITPKGAILFALVMFLTIAFALGLAMFLAIFAEDVQSANTVVSAGIMPLAFPVFVLMFTDIETLPAVFKYFLMALPFSHPILAFRAMLMGQYSSIYFSIIYLAILATVMLYITAKFFSTEKVLTAKLRFRRRT